MLFSRLILLYFAKKIYPALIIRALLRDSDFEKRTLNKAKADAWIGFMVVANQFLGNKKAPNYETIVKNKLMLSAFKKKLGCKMNLNIGLHFFLSNYEYFPDNFCDFSAENG